MSKHYAGGWGSIGASFKHLIQQKSLIKGMKVLVRMNKNQGVDCPGCAWPDPKDGSAFEFCENGVKAVAAETTSKLIREDFFKKYTISELKQKSDYWLEQQGRLAEPMYKPAGSDKYKAISWD